MGRPRLAIALGSGSARGWAHIGVLRALARQAMICLVLPTIVIGAERRALNDLALGTVVVNRR